MQQLRPAFVITGVVVVAAALAGQAGAGAAARAEARSTSRMVAISRALVDPPGLTLLDRGDCHGLVGAGRCLRGRSSVDEVAGAYRVALTQAAGRSASSRCSTLPSRQLQMRSCLVRIDAGEGHAVLISVDGREVYRSVDGSGRLRQLPGSRVHISAS